MGQQSSRAGATSPFLSERARRRAPEILSFAAVTGGAMLVSPKGEVVLFRGTTAEVDLDRVARIASGLHGARSVVSFTEGTTCVHAGPVCRGWMLCVLSTVGAYPRDLAERLRRASAVMALALVDGGSTGSKGGSSGPEGATAEVFVRRAPPRRN